VTLIGVSKTHPVSAIRAAVAAGLTDLGENYVREAVAKIGEVADAAVTWHFIGALQSNKTREVAESFQWVHTVDRLKIATRLSEQRPHYAPPLQVCLQVNIGAEDTKSGVQPGALGELAGAVAALPRLRLRGLMCIPPPEDDEGRQRHWFAELRRLRDQLNAAGHALDALSMGMSGDFELAIAEGATHVRVGTAIFGARS
jgi:pyridoxal phosphate enzyme (YggS family)